MISPRKLALIGVLTLGGVAGPLVAGGALYRSRTAQGIQLRYSESPHLRRSLERDVDYRGIVHINRYGFRGADFDSAKAAGTTRVIIVGASTTFDPCARQDSETWPARLEHWLTQLAPGRRFQVINAGVPGAPMVDQVIRLQTELYAFAPDVYVVYANHGIVTASDAGLDRSKLSAQEWQLAVDNAERSFRRDLTSFSLIARSQGAHVVFAELNRVTGRRAPSEFTETERSAWQRNFSVPPEIVHAGYERFRETWQVVADSVGATFIPSDSVGIKGPANYCAQDAIHFSAAGAEAMGHRMAELLITDGIAAR
jgi:hypothetical protein